MADISQIVRINAAIASSPSGTARFGRVLLLTSEDIQAASGSNRVVTYNNLAAVGVAYDTDSATYNSAAAYFAQTPHPPPLLVGRWEEAAVAARLIGAAPNTLTQIQGLNNGGLSITLNDASSAITISGIDLSGATSLSNAAALVQTAIRAASTLPAQRSTYTVAYDATLSRFIFTAGISSGTPDVINAVGGTVGAALGFSTGEIRAGTSGESVAQLIAALDEEGVDYYWLAVDNNIRQSNSVDDLAEAVEATSKHLVLDANEATLVAASPSGTMHEIAEEQHERTTMIYSETADQKAISLAGRLASFDFDGTGPFPTAKFKTLPGRAVDTLTTSEIERLDALRVNHYTQFGATGIVREGTTLKPNTFTDARFWLDWFVSAVQESVFGILTASASIPQTSTGLARFRNAVDEICERGRRNGGIAPGQVTEATAAAIRQATGNDAFDGLLSVGYLIYIGSLADLTATQLAERRIPTIRVWLHGSGAIHFVDLDITFD